MTPEGLPQTIGQREYSKFIKDIDGKVAVRTYDTALIALNQTLVELNSNYTQLLEYDADNNVTYIGIADPGSATSAAVWQIRHLDYDANNNVTSIKWADGDDEFNNIWDNRVALSYS